MNTFEKVLQSVTEKAAVVAQVAMVACMALVVANIIKYNTTVGEFPGASEIVELMAAIIMSMGIAYLTFVRGHVSVGVIVDRFHPRTQAIFDLINAAISLGFTIWLTEAMIKFGMMAQGMGWCTGVLAIPLSPFIYVVAAALAIACVVLIRDVLKAAISIKRGSEA